MKRILFLVLVCLSLSGFGQFTNKPILNAYNNGQLLWDYANFGDKYVFQSGNFDFANNIWNDLTSNNNDIDLVGGNALLVSNDVTITLRTPRVGGTIDSVNGTATTTGFVINETGNIAITAATAIDTIWSIKLHSGEEFRFTTGVSQFVFAPNNFGTISGTVNTDYTWVTQNHYHGNLQYGFSKMAYINNTYKQSFHQSTRYLKSYQPFTIHWEGFAPINGQVIFNNMEEGATYGFTVYCYKAYGIYCYSRNNNFSFRAASTAMDSIFSVEISYNGNGVTTLGNYTVTINGVNCTTSSMAVGTEDRNGNSWGGASGKNFTGFIKTYWVKYDKTIEWAFKDGVDYGYNLITKPTEFAYIPVFDGVESMGKLPTNPSFSNAHNLSETKIKFPETENLFDNDYNYYLFASNDSARTLTVDELYPNIGNKVWCDNHIKNKVSNIIISSNSTDYTTLINGFVPLYEIGLRLDGAPGDRTDKADDLLTLLNGKAEGHVGMQPAVTDNWGTLISTKKVIMGLHEMPPSFWKYGNFEEGHLAYLESTAGEKSAYTTIDSMGIIGYASTVNYTNSKTYLEDIHNFYLYPYPDGVTPQKMDNNSQWWSWVISYYKNTWETTYGGILSGITYLGALPTGIHEFHPEVWQLINDSIIRWNVNDTNYYDDLDNNNTVFSASTNASIVDSGDFNVQKLAGTGTNAYGLISFDDDEWKFSTRVEIKLDFYYDTDSTLSIYPLCGITPITFKNLNLSFLGTNYVNPCNDDGWYTIKIWIDVSNYYMQIYQGTTCLMYTKVLAATSGVRTSDLIIRARAGDVFIKDISVYSSDNISNIEWNHAKYDYEAYTTGNTYAQHLDKFKKNIIHQFYNQPYPLYLFSHFVTDPETKRADGTYEGVVKDRGYNAFLSSLTMLNSMGGTYTNMYDFVNKPVSTARRNLIRNGDFQDTIQGYVTTYPWGYASLSRDANETASFSKDGSDVVKLANGQFQAFYARVERGGVKWVKFYAKGNFQLQPIYDNIRNNGYALNTYTSATWKFYKIPIWYPENLHSKQFQMYIIATSDLFLHKLVIEDNP